MQTVPTNYTAVCSNTGSLTHWVRPGIKSASSWTLSRVLNPLSHNRISYFFSSNPNFIFLDPFKVLPSFIMASRTLPVQGATKLFPFSVLPWQPKKKKKNHRDTIMSDILHGFWLVFSCLYSVILVLTNLKNTRYESRIYDFFIIYQPLWTHCFTQQLLRVMNLPLIVEEIGPIRFSYMLWTHSW